MINSASDTRSYTTNGTVAASGVTHNTIYTANVLNGISQGTGDGNRIGDSIHIDHITLNCLLDTATGSSNVVPVKLRVMLLACTAQYTQASFGSGLGSSDLFYATSTNLLISRLNPRLCKLLCDEIIHIQPTVAAVGTVGYGHINCKVDAPFEFRTGTQYGTAANLYLVTIPYVVGGTSGTTQAGAFAYDYAVTFRDV
jgi:hypothetical protein